MIEPVRIQPQILVNQNFAPKTSCGDNKIVQNNTERNISVEAANLLKSRVLYSLNPEDNKFVEYLKPGMDKDAIINELCDKNKMGNGLFNKLFAHHIAYLITSSKNPDLAVKNFNIIMNTKDLKISKPQVYSLLLAANRVNGGELTKENIQVMLKEQEKALQDSANFMMGMAIGMNI